MLRNNGRWVGERVLKVARCPQSRTKKQQRPHMRATHGKSPWSTSLFQSSIAKPDLCGLIHGFSPRDGGMHAWRDGRVRGGLQRSVPATSSLKTKVWLSLKVEGGG